MTPQEQELDQELYNEIMGEADRLWEPFLKFVKVCGFHSWSPFCNHAPPYDYNKDGRPYNRCLKNGGYCKQLECPDYKYWLKTNANHVLTVSDKQSSNGEDKK
jgi:hypothetical protein